MNYHFSEVVTGYYVAIKIGLLVPVFVMNEVIL